jgi:ribosomal protein S3
MGQKVNPISLRTPINKRWDSKSFFPNFNYTSLLHQDLQIQRYVYGILYNFNVICNRCITKRGKNTILLNIYLYLRVVNPVDKELLKLLSVKKKGKKKTITKKKDFQSTKGSMFLSIARVLEMALVKLTSTRVSVRFFPLYSVTKTKYYRSVAFISRSLRFLNSVTYLHLFDLSVSTRNASLLAQFISLNLHNHIRNVRFFLRFLDRLIGLSMSHYGFRGLKLTIKGRLNGARRARVIVIQKGKVPLNTISANISYGFSNAMTIYGLCSVKVWIYL